MIFLYAKLIKFSKDCSRTGYLFCCILHILMTVSRQNRARKLERDTSYLLIIIRLWYTSIRFANNLSHFAFVHSEIAIGTPCPIRHKKRTSEGQAKGGGITLHIIIIALSFHRHPSQHLISSDIHPVILRVIALITLHGFPMATCANCGCGCPHNSEKTASSGHCILALPQALFAEKRRRRRLLFVPFHPTGFAIDALSWCD